MYKAGRVVTLTVNMHLTSNLKSFASVSEKPTLSQKAKKSFCSSPNKRGRSQGYSVVMNYFLKYASVVTLKSRKPLSEWSECFEWRNTKTTNKSNLHVLFYFEKRNCKLIGFVFSNRLEVIPAEQCRSIKSRLWPEIDTCLQEHASIKREENVKIP